MAYTVASSQVMTSAEAASAVAGAAAVAAFALPFRLHIVVAIAAYFGLKALVCSLFLTLDSGGAAPGPS